MVLRAVLILAMVGLAFGVWVKTWSDVRAKSRAEREWKRLTGTIYGHADPLHPDVRVEQGIELVAPPREDGSDYPPGDVTVVLNMEIDEGLPRYKDRRYEFLFDPATKRARVAGVRFSPFLLSLLGLVYLGLAAALYHVTSSSFQYNTATYAMSNPGQWVHLRPPPWYEPAVVSATSHGAGALYGLGAVVLGVIFMVTYFSRAGTLLWKVGAGSLMLLAAGAFAVYASHRLTYRIEADSTGLRESSAFCWRMTPWSALHGAVEETYRKLIAGGSSGTSRGGSSLPVYHTVHRVYFTDDQGEEVVEINDDEVDAKEAKALVAHVLSRTGLQLKK